METQKKNHNRRHKSKPKNVWKIINEVETTTTTDQDSDGTTGSVGGSRNRDSSSAYSSNIFEEDNEKLTPDISKELTPTNSKTTIKKKKKNKKNKKSAEKLNSLINALLVAALLVISGLASGHYIASHTSHVVSPTILNRYINRTIETYQHLLEENAHLRSKISQLEHKITIQGSNTEEDILQTFVTFFEKEVTNMMNILQETDEPEKIEAIPEEITTEEVCPIEPTTPVQPSFTNDGKTIPSSTKVDEFQTILADLKRKKSKKDPENLIENQKATSDEFCEAGTQITSYDSAHTGYVQHIKKLFEPEGDVSFGPQTEDEWQQDDQYADEYQMNYPSIRRSDIRDNKKRGLKDRSNEGNVRMKRKVKHNREPKEVD